MAELPLVAPTRQYRVHLQRMPQQPMTVDVTNTGPLDDVTVVMATMQRYVGRAYAPEWRPAWIEFRDEREES